MLLQKSELKKFKNGEITNLEMEQKLQRSRTRFHTVIWSVKIALLVIGVISCFGLLKVAVPWFVDVLLSTLPRALGSLRSWLSPPYLYIIVNFIIISIAASSSFQKKSKSSEFEEELEIVKETITLQSGVDVGSPRSSRRNVKKSENRKSLEKNETVLESAGDRKGVMMVEVENSSSPSTWSDTSCLTKNETETSVAKPESRKPPVPARSTLRKSSEVTWRSVRELPPAKIFVKSKSAREQNDYHSDSADSLDATWKAITEGRGMKLATTTNTPLRVVVPPEPEIPVVSSTRQSKPELRKSETFNETTGSSSSEGRGGGRLSKEKSLSQDELNRRVEMFITNFKNDIRLQRQESDQRYYEMVNRGVY